jgi:DNA-directed RNA polymerase specialized sigma24 family protein
MPRALPASSTVNPAKYRISTRRERARRVREVIAQLPEPDRDVLVMRDLDGLSYQEVA